MEFNRKLSNIQEWRKCAEFIYSLRGRPLIVYQSYLYCKNSGRSWRCIRAFDGKITASSDRGGYKSKSTTTKSTKSQQLECYKLPYPTGVWLQKKDVYFMLNQKNGYNLIFCGFMYKKEANFRATTNWICSNGNGKRARDNKCTARCIIKIDGSIKLGKNPHNHPPKFTADTLPAKSFKVVNDMLPIRL